MSRATDGQLSFGFVFEEGFEFPWDDDKYEGDIDEWWLDVRGFSGVAESPYDENGNYRTGLNSDSPEVSIYYEKEREWLKNHPLPVKLVNYCSGDYPMFVIASKSFSNRRGYPNKISPESLMDTEEALQVLVDFCEEFGIEPEGEAAWWLTSYTD